MTQIEKISLEALLPTGIRLRKGKKSVSLAVQTRKQITENGKTVIVPDFKTVKLDHKNTLTQNMKVLLWKH